MDAEYILKKLKESVTETDRGLALNYSIRIPPKTARKIYVQNLTKNRYSTKPYLLIQGITAQINCSPHHQHYIEIYNGNATTCELHENTIICTVDNNDNIRTEDAKYNTKPINKTNSFG
jgi:hypothetical protein